MTALTQMEILEELEKFGITTTADINDYVKEYDKYIGLIQSQHMSQS